ERAYEHEKYKHGVFFHYVLKGLRGAAKNTRGAVTFNSLAEYVQEEVPAEVPRLIGEGAQQSPNLKVDIAGASPVLLAGAAGAGQAHLAFLLRRLSLADAERWSVTPAAQPQVAFVLPGGGADQMGLRQGDVLLRVQGQAVRSVKEALEACKEIA